MSTSIGSWVLSQLNLQLKQHIKWILIIQYCSYFGIGTLISQKWNTNTTQSIKDIQKRNYTTGHNVSWKLFDPPCSRQRSQVEVDLPKTNCWLGLRASQSHGWSTVENRCIFHLLFKKRFNPPCSRHKARSNQTLRDQLLTWTACSAITRIGCSRTPSHLTFSVKHRYVQSSLLS